MGHCPIFRTAGPWDNRDRSNTKISSQNHTGKTKISLQKSKQVHCATNTGRLNPLETQEMGIHIVPVKKSAKRVRIKIPPWQTRMSEKAPNIPHKGMVSDMVYLGQYTISGQTVQTINLCRFCFKIKEASPDTLQLPIPCPNPRVWQNNIFLHNNPGRLHYAHGKCIEQKHPSKINHLTRVPKFQPP